MVEKKHRAAKKRVHVISEKKRWAVKKEGLSRASRVYSTKAKAICSARRLKSVGSDVIVHRSDGSILKWEKALPKPKT